MFRSPYREPLCIVLKIRVKIVPKKEAPPLQRSPFAALLRVALQQRVPEIDSPETAPKWRHCRSQNVQLALVLTGVVPDQRSLLTLTDAAQPH